MDIAAEFRRRARNGDLDLPLPGQGHTPQRLRALLEIARTDLALARLAEPHADAIAILREAGAEPKPGALYAVWASEIPGRTLRLIDGKLFGKKMFCTGASLVDRALVTIAEPEPRLADIDLRAFPDLIAFDESEWVTSAFSETHTATVTFNGLPIPGHDLIGPPNWYLTRPGFWHGACAPAACWAGGAIGLVDYAKERTRATSPHALAHLGAMEAAAWLLRASLDAAAAETDREPSDTAAAQKRALILRHIVEQACTEILFRFGRALGPRPLAFDRDMSDRCQQLTLYIRQSHAESDLEELGRLSLGPPGL